MKSKAEQTREFIIEKAAPVFNKKGYAGTSLSDIMKVTGLTKGAIYGNFLNKDEVATAVFEFSIRNLNQKISRALQGEIDASTKLRAFTDFYRTNWKIVFEKGGCPVQNASIEADDNLSFMKKSVQRSISGWVQGLSGIIVNGKTNKEFRKDIDAEEYAYTIIGMLEGGIMLAKIMNNQRLLFNALDRIDALVKNEMKRK
jgi:TetR/AcrR family transcriptional repressor of nem operon